MLLDNTSSDNKLECHDIHYPSLVYAGQSLTVDVVATGQQNGTHQLVLASFSLNHWDSVVVQLDYTKLVINTQVSNDEEQAKPYTSLNYIIYPDQSSITFSLTLQQASQAELR